MKRVVPHLTVCALILGAAQARAGLIIGHVVQNTTAAANATIAANSTATGTGSIGSAAGNGGATFTTNSINYNEGGTGTGSLNTFLGTTAASFSNVVGAFDSTAGVSNQNNLTYGTYILFTGQIYLSAGDHTFSITHDDGAQLSVAGLFSNFGSPGPTSQETETTSSYHVSTAGVFAFSLSYGEVNGLPAVLQFQVDGNNPTFVAPEPSTFLSASMAGLIGLGGLLIRRRRALIAV